MNTSRSVTPADPHREQPAHAAWPGWSKHRVEALTDGIFAVAMTLLVIELKIPDGHSIHTERDLIDALARLTPKVVSWVISFFVLATFWIGHHRLFHYVRVVDVGLLWRNIIQLAFVSLMPFSSALIGEFGGAFVSQAAYHGNLIVLSLLGIWKATYVRKHVELGTHRIDAATYHAMLLRTGGLAILGLIAIALAWWKAPVFSTFAYLLMVPISRYSRHIEARTPPERSAVESTPRPSAPSPAIKP